MEVAGTILEPLLEKAENYSKTSFELLKLQTIDKTADLSSTLFSRLLSVIVFSLFVLTFNIGAALWLGDILGKNYFGFLIVSGFYLLLGIFIILMHPRIKSTLNDAFVLQMFK